MRPSLLLLSLTAFGPLSACSFILPAILPKEKPAPGEGYSRSALGWHKGADDTSTDSTTDSDTTCDPKKEKDKDKDKKDKGSKGGGDSGRGKDREGSKR